MRACDVAGTVKQRARTMRQPSHHDDFADTEWKDHVSLLRHKCDSPRKIAGLQARYVRAAKLNSSRVTANQAGHDLQQCRFACAVGTDERNEFTCCEFS